MKKVSLFFFALLSLFKVVAQNPALDLSFGDSGIALTRIYTGNKFNSNTGLLIQSDGKILFSGNFIARFKTNGTPDSSFASNGFFLPPYTDVNAPVTFPNAKAICLQSDGKIVAIGKPDTGCSFIVRILPNGIIDSAFGQNGIVRNSRIDASHLAIQPDGGIVIVGNGCGNVGIPEDSIVIGRFKSDGHADSSFGSLGFSQTYLGKYGGKISGLKVLPDGRITVVGIGHDSGNVKVIAVRYLSDGSLDTSLGGTGRIFPFNAWYCHAVNVLHDGKMLLTLSNGTGNDDVARLLSNGTPDTSFGVGGFISVNGLTISNLIILDDSRILCGGELGGDYGIGCLNPNGKGLDSTFGRNGLITTDITGYTEDAINYLALQSDGKIVACGAGLLDRISAAGVVLVCYNANAATGIGIGGFSSEKELQVFPNPANTTIFISGPAVESISAVQIFSFDGRLIATLNAPFTMGIPLGSYPPNMYTLLAIQKTGVIRHCRFVVVR